ncbi:MAG: YitT family protein [Oscillospiraceae bacterium]|nr:YitT family protein [Oscillospiraceae bacterium]
MPAPRSPLAWLMNFSKMTAGTLLVAAGVYFFKFPNHFSTGGVSGIAIIVSSLVPGVSTATFVLAINVALLLLGLATFGRGFSLRTVYCSLLLSGALSALEAALPLARPLTTQPLLELFFSILLPAIGSAILFNMQASTGGTDILAMLLKRHTSLHIGNALLATDFLIAASSILAFGIEIGLFSILGLLLKGMVVDLVIEGLNRSKFFTIVTKKPDEICGFIVHELHRGATRHPAQGAFTGDPRTVVLCATNRMQALHLRTFVRQNDEQAFMMITNTSEILGKGFRGTL